MPWRGRRFACSMVGRLLARPTARPPERLRPKPATCTVFRDALVDEDGKKTARVQGVLNAQEGAGFLPRLPRLARPPVGIKRTTPQRRPEQCSTALCQASICERVALSNVRSDSFVIPRSLLEWRFCCKATICFPPLKPSLAVPSHVKNPPICTLFLEGGLPPNPATPVEAQPSQAEPNQLQGFPGVRSGPSLPNRLRQHARKTVS